METADTAPEPFTNTPEFGRFIAEIRSQTARSRRYIEEHSGPSERHQQDVESGKEMPITARLRAQYGQFLEGIEPDWRSFFDAACAAFSGAQHTPEPSPNDEYWPLYAGGGFTVGDLTRPGATITVGRLISPSSHVGDGRVGVHMRALSRHFGGDGAFMNIASRIATRHDGITVTPWPTAAAHKFTSGDAWPSHRIFRIGIASDGFPRLFMDPLREINDLEKAYLRAAALGAEDTDRARLAWAVLLANAAAAQTGTHPLQSFINLFRQWLKVGQGAGDANEPQRWNRLFAQLTEDTGVTTTVKVDEVIATAQRYLLPWTEDWLAAKGLRFNTFDEGGTTQVTWSLNSASPQRVEWSPEDSRGVQLPRLWCCDPAMFKVVPAVLADRNVGSLVLDDTELTATGSPHPQFIWCPVGAGDRYAVLREVGTHRWRSAVLY